jgi:steroid delta-isomerase-like uncharacterized protein
MTDDALIRRWAEAWNAHDVDALTALYTNDAVYEDVPFGLICTGHDEVRKLFESNFVTFGDDFRVDDVSGFRSDDRGVLLWTMSGTQIGDMLGRPSNGLQMSVRGTSVIDLRGDLIAHQSDFWDSATALRQLGHLAAR